MPGPAATSIAGLTHDATRLQLALTNLGRTTSPAAALDAGGTAVLYLGSVFIGAIGRDDEIRVSTAGTNAPGEFRPAAGPAGDFHISVAGDPRGSRAGLGRDPDDDADGWRNEDELNGLDDDGDGRIDEDFETIGHQMSSVTFRDDQVLVDYALPLGIEVRQKTVAWSNADLETFVGMEYRIRNVGDQHLRDLYFGYLGDMDIGPPASPNYWTDDLIAVDEIDTVVAGPEPSSPPVSLSIPVVFMRDFPDNEATGPAGDAPEVAGFFFIDHPVDPAGIVAPPRVGLTSTLTVGATSQFPGTPRIDAEFYDILSTPVQIPIRRIKPDDYKAYFGTGPFGHLDPGGELTVVLGFVVGESQADFRERVVKAQLAWLGHRVDGDRNPLTGEGGRETFVHWTGDYPLPSPPSNAAPSSSEVAALFSPPADDQAVRLQWTDEPETIPDAPGGVSFEGYQVWRAEPSAGTPAPGDWELVATYRLHPPDSLGAESPAFLERIRSGPHRYERVDGEGVLNGRLFHYAVTTLGVAWKWSHVAGRFELVDVPGVPASSGPLLVMPAWPEGESCAEVRVVPNPYRASAAWDVVPAECAPSGGRIALAHLPTGWTHVSIFSLSGDRVFAGDPRDSRPYGECETRAGEGPGGTFIWDLRNERGDEVTPGLYMYAVESPTGTCRGHFAIIR